MSRVLKVLVRQASKARSYGVGLYTENLNGYNARLVEILSKALYLP